MIRFKTTSLGVGVTAAALVACSACAPSSSQPYYPGAVPLAAGVHQPDDAMGTSNYTSAYANSQRNSRVEVTYRSLGPLVKVAHVEPLTIQVPSQFVLLAPGGEHFLVDESFVARAYTADGRLLQTRLAPERYNYIMDVAGFYAGPQLIGWGAEPSHLDLTFAEPFAGLWVMRLVDGRLIAVLHHTYSQFSPEALQVVARRLDDRSSLLWEEWACTVGVAAIRADGHVVVASAILGRFVVFSPQGSPELKGGRDALHPYPRAGHAVLDTHHGAGLAYEMSLVGEQTVLLSLAPPVEPRTDRRGPYGGRLLQRLFSVYRFPWLATESWHTWVHAIDGRGAEAWRLEVPMSVRQPAVDMGGGRLLLAGDGLAAVEHGRLVWQQPDTRHTYATAFADGHVAVAAASSVRIVTADGQEAQALALEDPEQIITTPPALGDDGSLWVVTGQAVYRARPR